MTDAAALLAAARRVSIRPITMAGLPTFIRGLTGAERRLLGQRAKDGDPVQSHELVALCVCTEDGAPVFTADQAAELEDVDGDTIEKVALAILEASGLTDRAQEAAAKN